MTHYTIEITIFPPKHSLYPQKRYAIGVQVNPDFFEAYPEKALECVAKKIISQMSKHERDNKPLPLP